MLWETSEETYLEVDKAINPANITWVRVFEDIQQLEEMVKAQHLSQEELCDRVFQQKLAKIHPDAVPNCWAMTVSLETPYQHDSEAAEDSSVPEPDAQEPDAPEPDVPEPDAQEPGPQEGTYLFYSLDRGLFGPRGLKSPFHFNPLTAHALVHVD